MNWVIYLFGSGTIFFIGFGLLGVALTIFLRCQPKWQRWFGSLSGLIGLLLIAASATPLPYWFYAIAGSVSLAWLVCERFDDAWFLAKRAGLRKAVTVIWVIAAGMELPYHWSPRLSSMNNDQLVVIGDSVSAGLGKEEATWPTLLAEKLPQLQVENLARAGATTAMAFQQADSVPQDAGLVILEIGGNDLLGATKPADFERDLDTLLQRLTVPNRTIVMFELPLPPFYNSFGLVQRRLASQYKVVLIPKREFAAVLTGPGATLDSIHLDKAGHEQMAEVVWSVISPAFQD